MGRTLVTDGGLRALFRTRMPGAAQWTSVETALTAQGVPDSEFCFPGGAQGWVEYKATTGWRVGLRPEQVGWLSWRARLGGRVFVATRRISIDGPRTVAADDLWMVRPRSHAAVVALRDGGLKGIDLASPDALRLTGGPRQWRWDRVEAMLRGLP